jgi:hypothetical protein
MRWLSGLVWLRRAKDPGVGSRGLEVQPWGRSSILLLVEMVKRLASMSGARVWREIQGLDVRGR